MFLIDENVPLSLVKFLESVGIKALRVSAIKKGASDREVVELAKELNAVIVTLDSDFTRLCFLENVPVVLIRAYPRTPEKVVNSVKKFLKTFRKHNKGLLIISESGAVKRKL